MRYLIILTLAILVAACDEVSPKQKKPQAQTDENISFGFSGKFTKDGKGGLFNNLKWYYYSLENHFVWPLFDVYAIKTPVREYYLQFVSYYDASTDAAGYFQVRIKSETQDTTIKIEAPGCGNPFTNPNFDACTQDPDQNIFTYLDLDTLTLSSMNDTTASTNTDWDIAFRGTDIKLNSGLSGPSTVVGAIAHRFPFFFEGGSTPSTTAVMDPALKAKATSEFAQHTSPTALSYFLPDGIDRVIHETYWYIANSDGLRDARPENWWMIQSHDGLYFAKIHFLQLKDQLLDPSHVESGYASELQLEWSLQKRDEPEFSSDQHILTLDLSTSNKTLSLCINLELATIAKCSAADTKWDIKLVGANLFKNGTWSREWRFFTSNGAIGPKNKTEMDELTNGHSQK